MALRSWGRICGGSRNKTGFGSKKYLDSWRKAGPESCSLAKQICTTADLVQSGDDEIRWLFPSFQGGGLLKDGLLQLLRMQDTAQVSLGPLTTHKLILRVERRAVQWPSFERSQNYISFHLCFFLNINVVLGKLIILFFSIKWISHCWTYLFDLKKIFFLQTCVTLSIEKYSTKSKFWSHIGINNHHGHWL